ncbi:T9SS type B sorting domain-containing protein [Flammeovirga sp. MY04]|uniref:T9SS type B sorting domain-containing protein n=1 Tax=Flammeovirga sp. MY04 TaxID=1191459 RepID=UPI0008063F31|nr:gliding motility-associated C-terminal domain-containing protein [Flammeovirga sp. MY04]ANQ47413.1 T9SS type B sorting domain-containing protein [Flammeovirga sp. MY04]
MRPQTYKLLRTLLLLTLVFIVGLTDALATHIRAGDLTMRRKPNGGEREYIITVILYRDVNGVPAGEGLIDFGDGTEPIFVQANNLNPGDYTEDGETQILIYQAEHNFPSNGTYKISYFERNRNQGVRNMDISSETPFFIQSEFLINPVLGLNSSPVLLIPPVIKGAIGQRFVHNAGAFDVDGDSLSYRLTVCLQGRDTPVQNYRFPDDPNEEWSKVTEQCEEPADFRIDEITGDLIWDAPFVAGQYNVAFFVEEWRNGILIGSVNRDMQVIIDDIVNLRPIIEAPADTCVVAGDPILKQVFAYDQSNAPCYNTDSTLDWGPHRVSLRIAQKSDAVPISPYSEMDFNVVNGGVNDSEATGAFSWTPQCSDVRQEPYKVTFRALDHPNSRNQQLGTLENWHIRVLGPPPTGLVATPPNSTEITNRDIKVTLNWDAYNCEGADKIRIYRKKGSIDFNPECETGLPAWTGYEFVDEVDANTTSFVDRTVQQGANYCYRIYATFGRPQGGESVASNEDCAFIPDGAYMVQVDVEETSEDNGKMNLRWTVPQDLTPGKVPFYNVYRGEGNERLDDSEYQKINSSLIAGQDTTLMDILINTDETQFHYLVELLEGTNTSDAVAFDTTLLASSTRLRSNPALDYIDLIWEANVGWNLTPDTVEVGVNKVAVYHKIYRKIEGDETNFSLYDSVFVHTEGLRYRDNGKPDAPLDDKKLYTYYIETIGSFEVPEIAEPLINRSQELTVELLDTIPPCPPTLQLTNYEEGIRMDSCLIEPFKDGDKLCNKDRFSVQLVWRNMIGADCDDDIVKYNIYYSRRASFSKNEFGAPIATIDHPIGVPLTSPVSYLIDNREYVEGSYAVAAVDDSGNESILSNVIIQDNCVYYELPNAFTPNGDNYNDTFIPMRCPRFVEGIEFTVINRYGANVYSYKSVENDGDIEINWDGKDNNGNELEPGNYYYKGTLKTYRLKAEDEKVEIKGSFVIIKGNSSQ